MSHWHKHVAKNHEIAKNSEIGAEIAEVQNGGHGGAMVTNGPCQCVRQPQNRGELCRKLETKTWTFFFLWKRFPDP